MVIGNGKPSFEILIKADIIGVTCQIALITMVFVFYLKPVGRYKQWLYYESSY